MRSVAEAGVASARHMRPLETSCAANLRIGDKEQAERNNQGAVIGGVKISLGLGARAARNCDSEVGNDIFVSPPA